MQSVYKFPIAMAVLDRVDKGNLRLDQLVQIHKADYIPREGYSPLREMFPEGTSLTLQELIRYAVAESDGTASDVLLKLVGGAKEADNYIHSIGIDDIAIATTEMVQVVNDTIQYQNWTTPKAMTELLNVFYSGKDLSENSRAYLLKVMEESKPGPKDLKECCRRGQS